MEKVQFLEGFAMKYMWIILILAFAVTGCKKTSSSTKSSPPPSYENDYDYDGDDSDYDRPNIPPKNKADEPEEEPPANPPAEEPEQPVNPEPPKAPPEEPGQPEPELPEAPPEEPEMPETPPEEPQPEVPEPTPPAPPTGFVTPICAETSVIASYNLRAEATGVEGKLEIVDMGTPFCLVDNYDYRLVIDNNNLLAEPIRIEQLDIALVEGAEKWNCKKHQDCLENSGEVIEIPFGARLVLSVNKPVLRLDIYRQGAVAKWEVIPLYGLFSRCETDLFEATNYFQSSTGDLFNNLMAYTHFSIDADTTFLPAKSCMKIQ